MPDEILSEERRSQGGNDPLRWLRSSIRTQFTFMSILLAVVPLLIVTVLLTVFSIGQARTSLEEAAFDRLVAIRQARATALGNYFEARQDDVASLVGTINGLRFEAFNRLNAINQNHAEALGRLFAGWQADARDISSDPGVVDGIVGLSSGYVELGGSRLRSLYAGLVDMRDAGDGSAYSAAHGEQHDFLSGYIAIHGYEDALLIDADGNVVYSVQKGGVYGTNLLSGAYRSTNLADLYGRLRLAFPGQIMIADAAAFDDGYAMFVGAPIYSGATLVGMFVLQAPFESIDEIVQASTGLGPTVESYLVGRIGDEISYRSNRVVKEGRIGDPRSDEVTIATLDGVARQGFGVGSTGAYEIAVHTPLDLPDVNWMIATTGAVVDVFVPTTAGAEEDLFARYIQQHGYYDLFLIAPSGEVFYTVAQESDYGTNILTGVYSNTNLSQLVAQIMDTEEGGTVDFAPYGPSGGLPAAFIAEPLVSAGHLELVVALQIPHEEIDAIVADNTGMGATGETYIVGADGLSRSQLRFDEGESLLRTHVDTEAVSRALNGETGYGPVLDYHNEEAFDAWQPLDIPGLEWVLVTEIDQGEALALLPRLQSVIIFTGLALLVVIGVVAVVAGTRLAASLVQPVLALTRSATAVAGGNLDVELPAAARQDEVGVLTGAFNTMTSRLKELVSSLQASAHVLEARTNQLEANQRAIQVVFSASGAFKTDELLGLVVNLIRDRFNLYHVQVYLLNEERDDAILRQSTGFAGQQLLARKHHIPMERPALVTAAIRENRPMLVPDVSKDPNFFANPLLPDTRSELVVPLRLGDEVIGALDAQDRTAGFFSEDTVALFETMAGQIGVMFQNAQLFTDVSETTEQLTIFTAQLSTAAEVARRISTILDPQYLLSEVVELIKSRFGFYHVHIYLLDKETGNLVVRAGSGEVGRVLRERGHAIALSHEKSLVARAARNRETLIVDDTTVESDFMPNPLLPQTRSELAVPLLAGDEVLGVLDIQEDQASRFGPSDRDTFGTLSGQIATALQNARSFEAQRQAEAEIRQLSRQNRLVLESAGEAIYGTDVDGVITFANPATTETLGWTVEELLGKHNHDLFHHHYADGRDYPRDDCPIRLAYVDEQVHSGEEFFWRKDGSGFPVEFNSTPVVEEGKVLGAVVTFRDITERKEAEAEIRKRAVDLQTVAEVSTIASTILEPESLLQTVVDLTKDRFDLYHTHIYLLDEDGENLVLAAGAGDAGRTMKAQGWQIPLDREHSLVTRAARERQGVIVNDVRAEADFMPNPLLPDTRSEMAVPMLIGDRVLGVLDVQSIRVGRFTEQDVAIKTTLARQVATALDNARLFAETQQVAERLREVDTLKSEFLANMSHELRTPLNSIIGYAELMLVDMTEELDEETLDDIRVIHQNGKHLLALINDILDLAKIEAGRLTLNMEDVYVDPLLEAVKTNTAGLLLNKPVEMVIDVQPGLPPIHGDPLRLNQVLNNLVSNAAKFTEQGSITLRALGSDGWVEIDVVDTGIGIAQEDLETIFERFRQADGSFKRRAEGTGLGLSITRHLVEMHGGTLSVQSEVGKGSTFTVRLPLRANLT